MKKIVTLSVLLFSICTFYWACKKDQTATVNKNLSTDEQQLIANAKTYFENNVQHTIQGQRLSDVTDTMPGQFNPVKSLFKNADWNDAYTMKLSIGKIVVVPIQFNNSLYARPENTDSSTRLPINNLSKLIVYSDSTKKLHAEVVTAFPDEDFIKSSASFFSGVAFVQDWQGNFLRAYHYKSGKINKLSLSGSSQRNNLSTDMVARPNLLAPPPDNIDDNCTITDWYTCVQVGSGPKTCSYERTTETGCDNNDSGGDGGGGGSGGTPGGVGYGIVAGGGGGDNPKPKTPNFVSVDSITSTLTNPCFESVLNTLEQKGLKNEITKILLGTFGVNDQINVIFQELSSIPGDPNADANTKPTPNSGRTNYGAFYDIITTLSDQQLANASKEFIAETIFHEIIHGYLDVNGSLEKELSQHITMIKSYVDCEVSALQEVFPNLSKHDTQCLVLGGFGDIQENNPATLNSVLSTYKLTFSDVANTNKSYKTGSKGTACGNQSSIP